MSPGFAVDSAASPVVLTVPSALVQQSSKAAIAPVRIDLSEGAFLEARVHATSLTAELVLLDSNHREIVRSDAISSSSPDDLIDEHLPAGTFFLQVETVSGPGTYTLTINTSQSSNPLQPIPLGPGTFPQVGTQIATGDFNGDGRVDIANGDSLILGDGDGTFQPPLPLPGIMGDSIVAGDFNGDGRLDLAIGTSSLTEVSVLLGNGDGTFQPPESITLGVAPDALVAGDFNGDGRLDLAVAGSILTESGSGASYVTVLIGNGNGTFQTRQSFGIGFGSLPIVSGDFNGDGRLDLATDDSSQNIYILLGDGDGTFQSNAVPVPKLRDGPLVAGDFNGDGRLDLVFNSGNSLAMLLGTGHGSFQPEASVPGFEVAFSMVSGDFNGDGRSDLVYGDDGTDLTVLLGNSDGSFQPPAFYPVLSQPWYLASADFNGDGRLDLAASSPTEAEASLLLGVGDGSFLPRTTNAVGEIPGPLIGGDFNGDGRTDVAVNAYSSDILIFPGNGDGTFNAPTDTGLAMNVVLAGDFNGDGRLDLVALTSSSSSQIAVLLGNGDGTFGAPVYTTLPYTAASVVAGDFNGDGRLDLLLTAQNDGTFRLLFGDGDGSFQAALSLPVGYEITSPVVADFNGDGAPDVAWSDDDNHVAVMLNNRDGTFQPPAYFAAGGNEDNNMTVGDFNGDGRVDIAISYDELSYYDYSTQTGVDVLIGNGDGTFQQATGLGGPFGTLVAGDFNDDGRLDLIDDGNTLLRGNGDGTFEEGADSPDAIDVRDVTALDLNGDGRLDLVFDHQDSDSISVLLRSGDGTFVDPGQLATARYATPLLADMNGDGAADALVVDSTGDILYRQGVTGKPGAFDPPVIVDPGYDSRDLAVLQSTAYGPLLASVDADDNSVSLFAWRNGEFVQMGSLATGKLPAQIIAGDFSGDGKSDLVVRNTGDGTLSIFIATTLSGPIDPATARQPFLQAITLPVGLGVSDVEAVDSKGSGTLDLVLTNQVSGQVSVLRNLGNGAFAAPEAYRAGTGLSTFDASATASVVATQDATSGVVAGKFNSGGGTDLLTVDPIFNAINVLSGLGDGGFANPVVIPTKSPAEVVRAGDFNHDGISDLAILSTGGLNVYLGNGKGGFARPVTYDAGPNPDGLTVADVNRDGSPDLLVGDTYGDILVLISTGNGTFEPYRNTDQAITLAVADLTGKGSKDVILADQGLDRVVVKYGAGSATVLGDHSTGLLGPGAVTVADVNGDGIPDLIVANSGSNNVLIYPGLGNGQFAPVVNGGHGFFTGTNPVGITVADVNDDGRADLVVADKGSNQVSILLNQGDFNFSQGPRLRVGLGPIATTVADYTEDGKPDILVTNSGSNNAMLLQGLGQGFFNDQSPPAFPLGNEPVAMLVTNVGGKPTLVTVNSGSNDLTLVSGFNSPDPVISTISSAGLDPVAAFAFRNESGFDDLVVANNGDGVFALFEGDSEGIALETTETAPDLPNPTALSFAGISGGLVQFYAATEGREAAALVALSLIGGDVSPLAPPPASQAPGGTAGLVALQETSLALVSTLLTLTIDASAGPAPEASEADAVAAGAISTAQAVLAGVGQQVSGRDRLLDREAEPGEHDSDENTQPAGAAGLPVIPGWMRFILDIDEALERFDREHPTLSPTPARRCVGKSSGRLPAGDRIRTAGRRSSRTEPALVLEP